MRRWQTWALVALVFAVSLHTALVRRGIDFQIYRTAGAHFLEGAPLYRADGELDYLYSPAAAAAFVPFALVPVRLGYFVFTALSMLAVVRIARWARRRVGGPPLVHAALLLVVPYLMQSLNYGQAEVLWLWLLIESEERASQPGRSGVLWALACVLKPPALIFVPLALARGQWKRLGAFAASGVAMLALALARYGSTAELWAWLAHLRAATPGSLCFQGNQSVFGIACSYWGPPETPGYTAAVAALATAVVLIEVVALARTRDAGQREFLATAFAVHLAGVLSPLGWWSNLFALTPMLYWLLTLALQKGSPRLRVPAAVALVVSGVAAHFSHHLFGAATVEPWLHWRYFGLSGLWVAVTVALCALSLRRAEYDAAPMRTS